MTTSEITEQAPAAVALIGPAGVLERATSRFLERYGADEEWLAAHQRKIDRIVAGEIDHVAVMLDGIASDVSAVMTSDGQRYALISVPLPPEEPDGDSPNPLLDKPIEDSAAVVWLKDLDGRYLRVNGRYVEELGADADHVCGKTDADLPLSETIEGMRHGTGDGLAHEPLELEYTVGPFETRSPFAVVRFALRDREGQPIAVCGVAAPLTQAWLARAECDRLIRIERWSRLDPAELREELLDEWGLAPLSDTLIASRGQNGSGDEGDGAQFAAIAAELDTALATSARLDRELAEERRQVMALREASILSARRAHELLGTVTAERARAAELEHAVSRAEARVAELESELASERSRAERVEAGSAEASAAQQRTIETLQLELGGLKEELERVRAAAAAAAADAQTAASEAQAAAARQAASLEAEGERADRAEAAVEELRALVERSESEASAALVSAQQRAEALGSELAVARERGEALEAELAVARERGEALEAELAVAREEAARAHEAAREELTRAEQAAHEELARLEQSAREEVAHAEQSAREEVARAEQAAREEVGRVEQAAREKVEQALRAAQDQVKQAQQAAREQVEQAQRTAREEIERVRQAATDAGLERAAETEAEAEATLATVREELRRAQTDAGEASSALAGEQQRAQALEAELAAVRAELERTQGAVAESVSRTEADERLAQAEAARAQAKAEAAEAQAALDAERRTVQSLRNELRAAREDVETARRSTDLSDRERDDQAQAALAAAREREEQAQAALAAANEREQRAQAEAAESAAALAGERDRVQALEMELATVREEAQRAVAAAQEAAAQAPAVADTQPGAPASDPPAPAGDAPHWGAPAQLALAQALAGVTELRMALQHAVKTLTTEGGWEAAIAFCPDERRRLMECVAISTAGALAESTFDTQIWQHRPDVSRREFGRAWSQSKPSSVTDLPAAEDRLLRAAAEHGMASAVLVPIRDGAETIALVGLVSHANGAPSDELLLSLEGVGVQIGAIGHLLSAAGAPRWRVGRL